MKYSAAIIATLPALAAAWENQVDGNVIFEDNFLGEAGTLPDIGGKWLVPEHLKVNNEWEDYITSTSVMQQSGEGTLRLAPHNDGGYWTSGRIESSSSPAAPIMAQPGQRLTVEGHLRVGSAAGRQGIWPAFWMLGESARAGAAWPACGEIDAFEQINGGAEAYGTLHCGTNPGGPCTETVGIPATTPVDSDWHTWSVVLDRTAPDDSWADQSLTWLKDGQPFNSLSGAQFQERGGDLATWATFLHSPLFIILNVAVAGDWPGPPNDQTESGDGVGMEVAWVVAYTN